MPKLPKFRLTKKPSKPDIRKEAIKFVKKNKKLLIAKFCDLKKYPRSNKPFTIFMAGSPGAGKTEFSKSLIAELYKRQPKTKIVRIDADDIREIIPHFNGRNSDQVQAAAAIGVEKIYDFVQKKKQNAIIDGTFAKYEIAKKNVKRALGRNRDVGVFYLYQNPKLAWDFTKKRERLEGRTVPKKIFIQAFFSAKKNVNLIKAEFKKRIEIHLIIKNYQNKVEKTYFNIDSIDNYLKLPYTIGQLKEKIA